jgi:hypothetical protein
VCDDVGVGVLCQEEVVRGGKWAEGGFLVIFVCSGSRGGLNGKAQENHVFFHSLSCGEDTEIVMFFWVLPLVRHSPLVVIKSRKASSVLMMVV